MYNGDIFKFRKYKYGPFCDDIISAVTDLNEKHIINEKPVLTRGFKTGYKYSLTSKGKKIAKDIFENKLSKKEKNILIQYKNKFEHYSPTDLLRYVYKKFPIYIESSTFEG